MRLISPLLLLPFLIPSILAQKLAAPIISVPERDITAPPLPSQHIQPTTIKILVCGDSITQGQEFDFTWRYRLWEWFRSSTAAHLAPNLQYVGPYNGTLPTNQRASVEGTRHEQDVVVLPTWGAYHPATNPEFVGAHFALYGRPAWQIVDALETQVEAYQPDLVVLHLGFNDIAWWGVKPAELVERMGWLVFRARLARRDVGVLVADVNSRLLLEGRPELEGLTREYNALLELKVKEWYTVESPVVLVRVREEYDCHVESCPAGFDGLHPNALGEYQIARAYSKVLHEYFDYGSGPLVVPPTHTIPGVDEYSNPHPRVRTFMGLFLLCFLVVFILRRYGKRERGFAADMYKRLPLAMQLKI